MPLTATAIVVGTIAVVAAICIGSGRQIGYAAGAGIVIAPIAVSLAVLRPYIFPYALYAAMIPFDNLLAVGHAGTITRYLGLLSGAALLFLILRTREMVRPSAAVGAWAAYAVWAVASIAWSVDPAGATLGALQIAQLVALYAIVTLAPISRGAMRILIGAIVLGGVGAGLYGSYAFGHASGSVMADQQRYSRLIVAVGDAQIDSNHFGDALLLPLMFAMIGALRSRTLVRRLWWFALIIPIVTGLALSASRGAAIGGLVGMIAIGVLAPRYRRALSIVGLFTLGISLAFPFLWLRFGQALATGGSGRTSIWRTGLAAAREHWLIGVGFDNFSYAYDDVYLRVFQPYVAGWSRPAHDVFLQVAVELGVVGLLLLAAAAVMTFRSGAAAAADTADDRELDDWRVASVAAMAALAVAAVFIDLVTYKYFWLALCTATQIGGLARAHRRGRVASDLRFSAARQLSGRSLPRLA